MQLLQGGDETRVAVNIHSSAFAVVIVMIRKNADRVVRVDKLLFCAILNIAPYRNHFLEVIESELPAFEKLGNEQAKSLQFESEALPPELVDGYDVNFGSSPATPRADTKRLELFKSNQTSGNCLAIQRRHEEQ